MLNDTKLQALKAKDRQYKVSDRDGLYVTVTPKGRKIFRYDYRLDGKRKTLTIGRYGRDGISLAQAREACARARQMVAEGTSPSVEKKRAKQQRTEGETVASFGPKYLAEAELAESTRSMRRSVFGRDILPELGGYRLIDVTEEDVRSLCAKIKGRGAPSTALIAREILKQMYVHAILHGAKISNPVSEVMPSSIATIKAKDRALTPSEIRIAFTLLERVKGNPVLKLGLKLILLTLSRKSEISFAQWSEVDFEEATWTIPKERMKNKLPYVVYLSRQALDILIALQTCAHGSKWVFPKRNDLSMPVSNATFNRFTYEIRDLAQIEGVELEHFTVHDLRRTGSTLLNEMGFNRDWIEKALAHDDRFTSRGVYNKAQYGAQRRHMLQEWADIVDAWIAGEKRRPVLVPPEGFIHDPTA